MQEHRVEAGPEAAPAIDSLSGVFLIVFAKAGGYVLLLVFAFLAARRPPWTFTVADLLFWATAIAIPLARSHVARKYEAPGAAHGGAGRAAIFHLAAAALLWVAAHSMQILA
jgi:hypothetical protein